MKKLFSYILLVFTFIVSAQNTLKGTVKDIHNQSIANAKIYLSNLKLESVSDTLGNFQFDNLPNGNFKITCSADEYISKNILVEIIQNETVLNIVLEENVLHMDEVIISTAFNKMQSQNVMKVIHESIKSLQQKGASTLIEGLAKIPGVSQISTGVSVGKPVIRGLSGNRVLVYSQGVRLENQQFGEEHGLGLNDSGVESVEVIKGPASLLYGSDALGGVLYFNPEKFAESGEFQSDFSQRLFSNTLGSNTVLGAKTSTDKWKFLARESYTTHSDYKIPDENRVTNSRYNENDFKTAAGYEDKTFKSTFRYNNNRLDIGVPENGPEASGAEQSTSKKTNLPKQGVTNHLLSLNNNIFFRNSTLDANLGYIINDRKEFEASEIAELQMVLKTFNYDLKYHFAKGKISETIAGIQGMNQNNHNNGIRYLIPNATTNDFGAYATTRFDWGSNVFQAGLRYDQRNLETESHGTFGNEGYFQALNRKFNAYNASLGYKTNIESVTIRLNCASGFRAPNLAELTSNGVHEGSFRYEIGNPNLKNEQNVQTDLNLEYKSSHFELYANAFYNRVNNYIYITPTNEVIDNYKVYQYNQNNAQLYGGETGIHFHPHPLDWLHLESSFEMVNGEKISGGNLPLIPAKKWNNTLRTEFKIGNWLSKGMAMINLETYFDQNKIGEFETRTGGYALLNFGTGGKIRLGKKVFDFNLNGNNLLNKTYVSHLSRLKYDGIPNMGRNIILGINFNL